ncbi:Heptahelical transmembrane protein [Quillaja saponaria]|uniref:Heptahelical transmembrane protein n=1 Tax=Quillaja saponaria TaxID=32244 RepID=A0AAD7L8K5_QUISA|nr:Heptahelical transmembrane protein [Quillaja saponaria]
MEEFEYEGTESMEGVYINWQMRSAKPTWVWVAGCGGASIKSYLESEFRNYYWRIRSMVSLLFLTTNDIKPGFSSFSVGLLSSISSFRYGNFEFSRLNRRGVVNIKTLWIPWCLLNKWRTLGGVLLEKGKRLWKKVKYQLVEYHSLPDYLRDNEFIVGHYRSEWPIKQVLFSIVTIHNETLNVWTHLIGFFLFLALTLYTVMKIPKGELRTVLPSMDMLPSPLGWHVLGLLYNCLPKRFSSVYHTNVCVMSSVKEDLANTVAHLMISPITRWPFFVFFGGAMFYLLASSTCHLFSCHSERLSYIMLRLDYAGIAALISTFFYPPVYYSFMCYPFFCNPYIGFITILGIATISFSLLPVFQNPEFQSIHASLFFGMGMSGVSPILHKLYLFWGLPEALHTTGYEILTGAFYGIGALIYATRIPERWKPGKFDIAGHSHQLFHLFVLAGAYTHYRARLVYLRWRDVEGC